LGGVLSFSGWIEKICGAVFSFFGVQPFCKLNIKIK